MTYDLDSMPQERTDVFETQWMKFMKLMGSEGILDLSFFYNPDALNTFAVTANGANLILAVASGAVWINGHYGQSLAGTVTLAVGDGTFPRIDRVVLRMTSQAGGQIEVAVLQGTPAGSPTAPALTQTEAVYELSLAQVAVASLATSVAQSNVTDERRIVRHPLSFRGPFGDGSDGNVTISTTITLTHDMDYNDLRIKSGGILKPQGFIVRVAGKLTIDAGGSIESVGGTGGIGNGDGNGGAGGLRPYNTCPEIPPPGIGADGGGNVAAAAGCLPRAGGPGATADVLKDYCPYEFWTGGGGGGGGSYGQIANPVDPPESWFTGSVGSGGGSGNGNGQNKAAGGGGGGSGGGHIRIWAKEIDNAGTISANGGQGGAGESPATQCAGGGGGGGGGGAIVFYYLTTSGSGLGSMTVAGGAGGAGGVSTPGGFNGANGTNGIAGILVQIQV